MLLSPSRGLQEQARAVRVDPPRNAWGTAQVKAGGGVLDTFLAQAKSRMR
ncbi:hypothetical protein AB0K02_14490 [Streptomyces sp. NPDC049597]